MNCKKYNYTLIEMLTVIAIICILAGLLIPAVNIARERGRETSATAGCNTIATAIRQYNMTYSKMPNVTITKDTNDIYTPVGGGSGTASSGSDDEKYDNIIFSLSFQLPVGRTMTDDQKKTYNKKKIAFMEVPPEYFETGTNKGYYANPWGRRYYIVYNTTGSNRMEFKRPKGGGVTPSPGNVTIGTDVAVFSEVNPGSKDFKTGKRLATSWKGITTF